MNNEKDKLIVNFLTELQTVIRDCIPPDQAHPLWNAAEKLKECTMSEPPKCLENECSKNETDPIFAAMDQSTPRKSKMKIKFVPQDCWIGLYWKTEDLTELIRPALIQRTFYLCLIPMFPITWTRWTRAKSVSKTV